MKITMKYSTRGIEKVVEFVPVSTSSMKSKGMWSFGVPQKIKRICDSKSFKLIEITAIDDKHDWPDDTTIEFAETGLSIDQQHLYFHFKAMRPTPPEKTYNGWKNYNTWNVSLWINNDEGLYNMAKGFMKEFHGEHPYMSFAVYLRHLSIPRTPDGVRYCGLTLDCTELDNMMLELVD